MDDPNYWKTIRDKNTGREVILTDQQIDMIQTLQKSKYPSPISDPYEVQLHVHVCIYRSSIH